MSSFTNAKLGTACQTKIFSSFRSNVLVRIMKTDFKFSRKSKVRYLDLTHIQNSGTSRNGEVLFGGCSKNLLI
jgi:hypothetical protein